MPHKQVVDELCQHAANRLEVLLHFPASSSTLSHWIVCGKLPTSLTQCTLTSSRFFCYNRKTALKEAFSALMLAEPAAVAAAVQRLTARLRQQEAEGQQPLGAKDALALRLNQQYPEVTAD